MKKYFLSIILGLVIGFFLSKSLFEKYNNFNGIKKVSQEGEMAYFIKYGEYDSLKDLEKNTIKLTNYIYTEENEKFIVYIGMTFSKDNFDKLTEYFKKSGYKVTSNEYIITNKEYINYLRNADKLIENSSDDTVIGEVCSQILSKYEELVINERKD